jgi:branched-chain amino acid transport system ATP-binding protein
MTALLTVAALDAGYFGQPVVRDLNLRVEAGEAVALLGANGTGKTTTLSTIAGLLKPISGTIEFGGRSVVGLEPNRLARQGMALVPEDRSLFPSLTARENLRLGHRKGGITEREVLEMLPELEKCLDRRAGVLSGGEQQMLAIARALVSRPKLLLVDELSLGLAPVVVERLMPVLRRVADELGAGVLFVEQHVVLALEVADRAYVFGHGGIALEGKASELRASHHLLEASYLGEVGAQH